MSKAKRVVKQLVPVALVCLLYYWLFFDLSFALTRLEKRVDRVEHLLNEHVKHEGK